jgi:DNA-binding NarL/FixJ family response regulator
MSIRILLADDHKIFREGMRGLLEKEADMLVIGEASNGKDTVRLAQELHPDVVVMDITMPDLNGIDATSQVKKKAPHTKVLCLSMHSERNFVLAMFKAGAAGYLLKNCAFDELTRAIYAVFSNKMYVSPQITHHVIDESLAQAAAKKVSSMVLTPREREVLQLIAEGKSTKQIADRLHRGVKTIETHRRRIMQKLDIRSVAELTKYAISEGLTSLDT